MGGRERPGGPTEGAGSVPTGWAPARHGGRQPATVGGSPSGWAQTPADGVSRQGGLGRPPAGGAAARQGGRQGPTAQDDPSAVQANTRSSQCVQACSAASRSTSS